MSSGADWVIVDPQTGLASADARYAFQLSYASSCHLCVSIRYAFNTTDGDFIFIRTDGPMRVEEYGVHLRIKLETGSRALYWLNEVLAFGILSAVPLTSNASVQVLRIDAWHRE